MGGYSDAYVVGLESQVDALQSRVKEAEAEVNAQALHDVEQAGIHYLQRLHIAELEAALGPLLTALRYIADVRWRQALDGQLPDGFVLTTIYDYERDEMSSTMNSRSFTAAHLRRAAELVGEK